MINPAAVNTLISHYGILFTIPTVWMKAIITQESQWNPFAIRYEPNYRYLYQTESFAKIPLNNLSTEMMTQRMSWGLAQIMGGLAREQGHQGLMGELLDPETNLKHLCIRIRDLRKISALPDDIFAMYNGGPAAIHKSGGKYSNQVYVDAIHSHLQNVTP